MQKNLGALLLCCVAAIAALAVITIVSSCGGDASTENYKVGVTMIERDLEGGLTIVTLVYPPDFKTAQVIVSVDFNPCLAFKLTEGDGSFTFDDSCGPDGHVSLDLQYLPAADSCEPGGLYLIKGTLEAPKGAASYTYTSVELAAWDAQGMPLDPSFRPFQPPTLFSQTSKTNWAPGAPLDTLGSWTYSVEYGSSVSMPPVDCPLKTSVELTLTPAAGNIDPRVYHYVAQETNTGEEITANIMADNGDDAVDKAAPEASIEPHNDESSGLRRLLTFTGLDALGDARAQVRMEFMEPAQVVAASSAMDPLSAFVSVDREIAVASGSAPAPLASHLASFLSELTAPLTAASDSSTPTIHIQITAYLSTPAGDGVSTVAPLALFPIQPYTPGLDDNDNCAALPPSGLVCNLAADLIAAVTPDPSASYIFDIAFWGADDPTQPLLRIERAVLPVSTIIEYRKD